MMMAGNRRSLALNGICPYFTMFPIDFPHRILSSHARTGDWVLDPFCGRGTTLYAGRVLGLSCVGIDSHPVAVALSQAKLANTSPESIVRAAARILDEAEQPTDVPTGEFWEWAFQTDVLRVICRLREGLIIDCSSDTRKALRAILLGALHGPQPKSRPSYLSNQCQRTYAPKPGYAVRFWKSRESPPPSIDVMTVIQERAHRYYGQESSTGIGRVTCGDSRDRAVYYNFPSTADIDWVITSPPYYGMRTYIPDQWLRLWFLGGKPTVDYSMHEQIEHSSPSTYASQLQQVWHNVAMVSSPNARLIIRFGAINDRRPEPLPMLLQSLWDADWKVESLEPAGSAAEGRRQSLHFSCSKNRPLAEYDVWAVRRA